MKKFRQQLLLGLMLGLLTLLLLTNQAITGTARKEINQTFNLRQGGSVSLKNTSGQIEISSWDKQQVELRAVITVKHRSRRIADEYLQEIRLDFNDGRDYLEIDVDYPHKRGPNGGVSSLLSWLFGGGKPSVNVNFYLIIPEKTDLNIDNVNGRIEIYGIRGKIKSNTTNGRIKVTKSSGEVSCKTVNGSISVELEDINRFDEMTFKTVNGGIRLAVPAYLKANLEASTTNGSINSALSLKVKGKLSRRRVKGQINGGGGELVLKTVNGSISIFESD